MVKLVNLAHDWLQSLFPHILGKINRVSFGLLSAEDLARQLAGLFLFSFSLFLFFSFSLFLFFSFSLFLFFSFSFSLSSFFFLLLFFSSFLLPSFSQHSNKQTNKQTTKQTILECQKQENYWPFHL